MVIRYLNEMRSWILFFLFSLSLMDAVILLDEGIKIEISALLYINGLVIVLFLIFLIWRFQKEMKYTKALRNLSGSESEHWHDLLPEPRFFREQQLDDFLNEVIGSLEKNLSDVKNNNLIENNYTAAWVHEVKAPLTAMKLIIDANKHELAFRKLETEWLRVHLLIDQQLSIVRLPTLESDYVLEVGQLNRLVADEIRELASWCMEKNLAIEMEGEAREVITDLKWCRFIIRQILTNAVKYSPFGGTITIDVEEKESGNKQLIITDEGPGIKPHDLPRIFDKGFTGGVGRIHNAATGLGLYLANTVADKIGITLSVQSEEEKGTTIFITFSKQNEFDQLLI